MGSRWGIRILMVAFGLFFGTMLLTGALSSVPALGTVTLVGTSLQAVGTVGLFASVPLGFRVGKNGPRRSEPGTDVPGGRRGLRLARRQIDGKEPYRVDEIPHLRALAVRRMSARRPRPAEWTLSISLIVWCTGCAMAPSEFHNGAMTMAFRVLAVVILVVVVVQFVARWRPQSTAKIEAFLLRTQPAAGNS